MERVWLYDRYDADLIERTRFGIFGILDDTQNSWATPPTHRNEGCPAKRLAAHVANGHPALICRNGQPLQLQPTQHEFFRCQLKTRKIVQAAARYSIIKPGALLCSKKQHRITVSDLQPLNSLHGAIFKCWQTIRRFGYENTSKVLASMPRNVLGSLEVPR